MKTFEVCFTAKGQSQWTRMIVRAPYTGAAAAKVRRLYEGCKINSITLIY
jgi:hypothetical protein